MGGRQPVAPTYRCSFSRIVQNYLLFFLEGSFKRTKRPSGTVHIFNRILPQAGDFMVVDVSLLNESFGTHQVLACVFQGRSRQDEVKH